MIYDAKAVELWWARKCLIEFRCDLPSITSEGEKRRVIALIEKYEARAKELTPSPNPPP